MLQSRRVDLTEEEIQSLTKNEREIYDNRLMFQKEIESLYKAADQMRNDIDTYYYIMSIIYPSEYSMICMSKEEKVKTKEKMSEHLPIQWGGFSGSSKLEDVYLERDVLPEIKNILRDFFILNGVVIEFQEAVKLIEEYIIPSIERCDRDKIEMYANNITSILIDTEMCGMFYPSSEVSCRFDNVASILYYLVNKLNEL